MAGVVWWLINLEKKGVGGDSVSYIELRNNIMIYGGSKLLIIAPLIKSRLYQ